MMGNGQSELWSPAATCGERCAPHCPRGTPGRPENCEREPRDRIKISAKCCKYTVQVYSGGAGFTGFFYSFYTADATKQTHSSWEQSDCTVPTLGLLLIRIYKLTHISNLEVALFDPNSGDFVKCLWLWIKPWWLWVNSWALWIKPDQTLVTLDHDNSGSNPDDARSKCGDYRSNPGHSRSYPGDWIKSWWLYIKPW